MMRTRFYLLLLLVVASLVVVPEVKAHEAVPVGTWTATGSMATARSGHSALLGNGKVLVVGGLSNAGHALATAELFGFADTTAPTLQMPAPITADATSPQGATVTYTVTATDPDNTTDQIAINCTPASGSVFPIGTTTVNCSAQDPAGNIIGGNFPVVVQNVTPPTLQLPATITMNATDTQGATVNYLVSATDPVDTPDQIVVSCTPLSGSVFPVGSTTVNCSAQDAAGNATTGSFQVVVQDVTAPALHMPVTITADATDQQGAVIDYSVNATDPTNSPDQLTISCTPPSGSEFPIGTTTVVCGAQDPSGNTTTGTFQVVVSFKAVNIQIDAM